MCGICGVINKDRQNAVDAQLLKNMADKINHRGPDDEGFFFDRNIGIAIKRLSIIDLDGGHQPVCNEDGTVIVVFNGEVYNHAGLRTELNGRGHKFRSGCDTEVLVHLYEEYGKDMVEHLNGMFAFCLYDSKKKNLLIARDRLGIKPIYYFENKDRLVFGSEIKSFLCLPDFSPEVDFQAFHHYLTFRFVPTPFTMFKGVKKLPPGSILEYQIPKSKTTVSEYWDLNFDQKTNGSSTIDMASENVNFLINDSVQKRLMSDVPLGAMLSGGIDSSGIVSFMKNGSNSKISTFTVGYQEEGIHNEGEYAKIIADEFDTDHHEKIIGLKDFFYDLEHAVYYMDEPIADPSAMPILDLCRFSKEYVTVLLSGVGGDELFAGYKGYKESVYSNYINRLPGCLWKFLFDPFYGLMPDGTLGKNFSRRTREPLEDTFLGSSFHYGGFSEVEKKKIYSKDFAILNTLTDSHEVVKTTLNKKNIDSRLHSMMYFDLKHWLADSHLVMMDKMSMANSMELRTPLLDHRLVEYAASLPEKFKISATNTKIVLKEALKSQLPKSIINRRKRGFSTPLDNWIHTAKSEIVELLTDKNGLLRDVFDISELKQIVDDHLSNKSDRTAKIFTLIVWQIWSKKFKPSLY
jgi:asparagine synthase (glutamine-hydrolysing)